MGYAIKIIDELENFDFSDTFCTKESVRLSIDGSKFIVEGNNINDYTREEMLVITQGEEWQKY